MASWRELGELVAELATWPLWVHSRGECEVLSSGRGLEASIEILGQDFSHLPIGMNQCAFLTVSAKLRAGAIVVSPVGINLASISASLGLQPAYLRFARLCHHTSLFLE